MSKRLEPIDVFRKNSKAALHSTKERYRSTIISILCDQVIHSLWYGRNLNWINSRIRTGAAERVVQATNLRSHPSLPERSRGEPASICANNVLTSRCLITALPQAKPTSRSKAILYSPAVLPSNSSCMSTYMWKMNNRIGARKKMRLTEGHHLIQAV
jgi:hypothetical protein